MDIPELEAFVATLETGSVSQAARRLNRVQSTISLRISNLEARLGVSLFDRSYDGLAATEHGTKLYGYAVEILRLVREAANAVEHLNRKNFVRVGFIEIIPSHNIDRVLEITESHQIRLNIKIASNEEILDLIDRDFLDIAVSASGFAPKGYTSTPLYSEKLILVSSSSIKEISRIEEILKHPFYVHSKKSASRRNLDALFREAGSKPDQISECGSYKVLFSTIARHGGFSLVANAVFQEYGQRYDIRRHEITGRFTSFSIDMIYKTSIVSTSLLTASHAITEVLKSE